MAMKNLKNLLVKIKWNRSDNLIIIMYLKNVLTYFKL